MFAKRVLCRRFRMGAQMRLQSSLIVSNPYQHLHKYGSFSITSYFRLPEQDMHDYELLSRGSTVITPVSPHFASQTGIRFHILTSAHITHPFLFQHLYKDSNQEWLQHVGEQHTIFKLQYRDNAGNVLHEFDVSKNVTLHSRKDVVALHLEQEDQSLADLMQQYGLATVELLNVPLPRKQKVVMVGFDLVTTGENEETLVPNVVDGYVNTATDIGRQVFVATAEPLRWGMCGSTVLLEQQGDHPKCVGIVEGIYQGEELTNIKDNAAFISSAELVPFLQKVEARVRRNVHLNWSNDEDDD